MAAGTSAAALAAYFGGEPAGLLYLLRVLDWLAAGASLVGHLRPGMVLEWVFDGAGAVLDDPAARGLTSALPQP